MAVQQNTQTPTVSTTEVTQHDTRFALTERRLHESGHSMAGPEKHSVRTDGNGLHFVWVRDLFRVSEEDVREPKIHRNCSVTHNKKHNNPTHTEDYGVLTNQKKIASQIFQSARRNYIPYVEWVVVISYQIFDFRPILN